VTEDYYDNLAPYYRLIYQDWNASIGKQGIALDGVIGEFFGEGAKRILDAACGIGTQSIGLAERGYLVHASDISKRAISEGRTEAIKRGLQIEFRVTDMRRLVDSYPDPFDVVIACDNAIPHLLSNDEIRQVFEQFFLCTTSGGGCIISLRDYAEMETVGVRLYPRSVHHTSNGRVILFDSWNFEGDFYDLTTYVVEDNNGPTANTHVIRGGRYYCVSIATIENLLVQAGFQQVATLRDRFFQPLVVGMKSRPSSA
jgi:SAM-dependent methyltransferase